MNWHDPVGPGLILLGIAALAWLLLWFSGRDASVCTCDDTDNCTCGGAWGEKR